MRCLSPAEVEAIFGGLGFRVSLEHAWYRSALILDQSRAVKQTRIDAEQPRDVRVFEDFVRALNRWLPTNRERLLWVDHWQTGQRGGAENAVVAAAWRGLGETRSLDDAPGLLLEKQNWDEEDQPAITPAHAESLGMLAGITALVMMTQSDGWLISASCLDRIEFWEGHVFFHSADPKQLRRAGQILNDFGCTLWKKHPNPLGG